MNFYRSIFFWLFLPTAYCLLPTPLVAQLLDSASLSSQPVFNNLDSALLNPDKVYRLNLRGQKLKIFPENVLKLKNLQELDLSKNKLTSLPEKIGLLTNLQILNVSVNQIETLPDSIGMLIHLERIIAFKNNLIGLPRQIGNLENLEVLDIWSNDLAIFPEELSKLKKLRWMDLRVILLNDDDQDRIKKLLPNAKIFFSPSCKCVTGG